MGAAGDIDGAVRSARKGDRDAFAILIREHQAMVFSIAWNYLRNEAAAEELAQEVFLELFQSIASIESPAHLTFWLRKVATHRCIDYTRRRRNRPGLALAEVPEPSAAPAMADPFMAAKLHKLTASLPEKPRMVVILRFQEDLDPSEIASVLGMPLNTVKSHLQRSLAVLREKFRKSKLEKSRVTFMSPLDDELKSGLKSAVRRREPPPGFADRVMLRLPAAPNRRWGQSWMAVAAAVLIAILGVGGYEYQRSERAQQEGERAKAQLVFALELASEKLQHTRVKVLKNSEGQL